jgi:arylsulfatase A-like enzyme
LGYADLSCQGSKDVRTPHIDSIADDGVRCTAAYVTAPQCGPSRAAILSGRYQSRLGFESNEFAYHPGLEEYPLISERLKSAGYKTGYMGKWGVANKKRLHPPERGFDESFWNQNGNVFFPLDKYPHGMEFKRGHEPVELKKYSTEAITDESLDFIKRNGQAPFFLFVSYIAPHVPMEALEKDLKKFPDVKDPLRKTMLAMMANMDDGIGRILNHLKSEGLYENTIIYFMSDNGGSTVQNASRNDPFSGTKSQMLEGGVRVPFIIKWKGQLPEGAVYKKPVSSLDVAATSYVAAGLKCEKEWKLDGVDLVPFLSGENKKQPHKAIYWRFDYPLKKENKHGWGIRKGKWKLVRNGWASTPVALYDLENDPGEKQNLINTDPERAKALQKIWDNWDKENVNPGTLIQNNHQR